MSLPAPQLLRPWASVLVGLACRQDELPGGITRLRLSSRITRINGMLVAVYRLGGVLIDTGFAHVRELLDRSLAGAKLQAVVLTHHHEDHSGGCAVLAARHGCPIYLRNPRLRHTEGLDQLKPYRRAWWGEPAPFSPQPMPERIDGGGRSLRVVPIPGHSVSHTAVLDELTGSVFVGDLFVSGGVSAVMSHENPFESVASLRRVADLAPAWMFTGHGLAIERPVGVLREKAERIEQAATEVLKLHGSGLPGREIVRQVFPVGRTKDRVLEFLTQGEFSRLNFVRCCLRAKGRALRSG